MNTLFTSSSSSSETTFFAYELEDFTSYLKRLGYAKTTVKGAARNVKAFLVYLEMISVFDLAEIKKVHIENYLKHVVRLGEQSKPGGLSRSYLKSQLYAVGLLVEYCLLTGRMESNPCQGVEVEAGRPEVKRLALSLEQIKRLYAVAETLRDRAMLGLLYGCGLRRSEAMAVNLTDVDFTANVLVVRKGKGAKSRIVPMSGQVATDLKNYLDSDRGYYHDDCRPCPALILSATGRRYYNHWKRLKAMAAKADLPESTTLHSLRHSIATHLLEAGVRVDKVKDFLGHSFLDTTQIYTHVDATIIK